jgi:hypothetical protein
MFYKVIVQSITKLYFSSVNTNIDKSRILLLHDVLYLTFFNLAFTVR